MSNLPVFVGLDYHQDSIQVCVLNQRGDLLLNRAAKNDVEELARVVEPLGAVQRVGIEACCGAADLGEELVRRLGWNVSLGHPAYIAKMKKSPDKSDYSDGRLLADLTRVGYLPLVWLPPIYIRELRQLVNHRQRLVDQKRSLKLQIGAILREQRVKIDKQHGVRWSRRWVERLGELVEDVGLQGLSPQARWIIGELLADISAAEFKLIRANARLDQATQNDPVIQKLRGQAGIGPVTSWVMRACIGDFNRFKTAKQLARYCGMSPCNASSGNKTADAGLIVGCNRLLRMTIIQAAHRLMRTSPRWIQRARSMADRGKPTNVIVAAVGNRWMRTLHHVMKGSMESAQ